MTKKTNNDKTVHAKVNPCSMDNEENFWRWYFKQLFLFPQVWKKVLFFKKQKKLINHIIFFSVAQRKTLFLSKFYHLRTGYKKTEGRYCLKIKGNLTKDDCIQGRDRSSTYHEYQGRYIIQTYKGENVYLYHNCRYFHLWV